MGQRAATITGWRFLIVTIALVAVATIATGHLIVTTSIAGAFLGMRYIVADARNKLDRQPNASDTSLSA